MDQTKIIVYLEYAILAMILPVGLLPLFDTVTSILIIVFLFVLVMTLLYFGDLFSIKKFKDFEK